MLPMHERLCMGRAIVPRVRQVVNCLLFPHYLSVTWTHRGKGNSPSFHFTGDEQIVLTGCSLVHDTGHQSIHLRPAAIQPASKSIRVWLNAKKTASFQLTHPSWRISRCAVTARPLPMLPGSDDDTVML